MAESREVLNRQSEPGTTVAYGGHADQVIELFIPAKPPRATVVAIHGGFWRHEFDRTHLRPFSRGLLAEGFAVVMLEYRRTGGGGGWPATFDDVRSGMAALDDVIAQHGLAEDVIVAGHSAGGHLGLWAAAQGIPPRPVGVLGLAAVTDLARCHREGLDGDAAQVLMGGGPADHPKRYAAADPMRLPMPSPVTLVHGRDDQRVPIGFSRDYATRTGASLHEVPDIGHFELIDPLSSGWPVVLAAFENFQRDRLS